MEGEEKKYHQIEKYLAGELRGKELQDFEIEMQNNTFLRKEIELHKEVANAVTEQDIMDFRRSVKTVIKNTIPGKSEKPIFRWRYVGIAASIAIVMFIGIKYAPFNKQSTQELYSSYYTPYENLISGRGDESLNDSIAIVMVYYDQQKYDQVVKLLNTMNMHNKPLLELYKGISYLNIDEIEKAHSIFGGLITSDNSFRLDALWYNALAYLKEGDRKNSKMLLEEIIAISEHSKNARLARNILRDM